MVVENALDIRQVHAVSESLSEVGIKFLTIFVIVRDDCIFKSKVSLFFFAGVGNESPGNKIF